MTETAIPRQHAIHAWRPNMLNLLLALTLDPVVADLAAGATDKALAAVHSPGHEDGWTNQGQPA